MRYIIFKNIKRWLIEYGVDVLDLVLNPKNLETVDPKKRYCNDLNTFFDELNAHVSYTPYFGANFGSHLPLLQINIHDLGEKGCDRQYMIEFLYHYTHISANQEYHICNTPEEILRLEDDLNCALEYMMKSCGIGKNGVYHRNIFSDMRNIEDFNDVIQTINYIESYPLERINTKEEVHTLNKSFILTIGECNGYI